MSDLSKLGVEELLDAIGRAGEFYGFDPSRIATELRRRLSVRDARISELEQERTDGHWSAEYARSARDEAVERAEAAEKERDEAYESCRLMEDRLNRLVDQSARVVVLEAALREYGRHLPPCALWITMGDAGPNGEQHPCTCGLAAALSSPVAEEEGARNA